MAGRRHFWLPSLSDCLFVSLLVRLFVTGSGWSGLLADGDTGWHIRAGEYVLDHHRPPTRDLFSFSKAGQPWFAWEWLSDVLLAVVYRQLGLKGVVLLAGAVVVLALTVVFRHMLWRGANVFLALLACLLGAGASGIHYLARPHVFTLLLLALSLWLLEADRRRPTRAVWALVPLTAIWTNLHGGFLALPICLSLLAAGAGIEMAWSRPNPPQNWFRLRRYAGLLAASSVATLLNPYGIQLHGHIAGYLRSEWIQEAVQEFQPPRFRSESSIDFELLLFAGVMLAGSLLHRRQAGDALLILFWAHAALVSARHIPIFVVVASPVLTAEASLWWRRWTERQPARSVPGIFERLAQDLSKGSQRSSIWIPLCLAALVLTDRPVAWPRDFPEAKFPVALVQRHGARLAGARVFTSDQWGDYLIYRFYPGHKVFIDGRSDFYGPDLGKLYLRLAYADAEWRRAFERYGIELVLAPVEWPLAGLLRQAPGWRVVEEDSRGVLFEKSRPGPAAKETDPTRRNKQ